MIPALLHIETIARTRAELNADPARLRVVRDVQMWQVARLRRTYADCEANERYRPALEFFIEDLYGPHDFGQRDRDLKKVIHSWHRLLPQRALDAVTRALELEALSQALDLDLVRVLNGAALNETTYARAYCQANRREDRQRQIWLILSSGRALDELIRYPWVPTALRLARNPARLAGVTSLHAFLERGYAAFKQMGNAEELLRIIEQRETAIMQNLFADAPNPFDVDVSARARRKA